IRSPKRPQKKTENTNTKPSRPSGSPNSRRRKRLPRKPRAGSLPPTARSKIRTDTGIEPGDDEIGQQRGQDEQSDGHQHRTLNHREVAACDHIDDELADAWAREHLLGENSAGKQASYGQPEERDRR